MQTLQTLIQPFFSHSSSSPSSNPLAISIPPATPSSPSSLASSSSSSSSSPTPYNVQSTETRQTDAFHTLVSDLSDVLGPSSGLDSEEIDPKDIMRLMEGYTSQEEEWKRYAYADGSRGYTRNLVDEGNGKSNLLILVWSPGKGSAIHDHANAHCVMKILKGRLRETLYDWPEKDKVSHGEKSPLKVKRVTTLEENQVAYMSDQLGLHKIVNPDPSEYVVSLHLYTPPHAAHFGFSIFDPKTGKSSHIPNAPVYSDQGKKI